MRVQLTSRQVAALADQINSAQTGHGVDHISPHRIAWDIEDEIRPGRGHDLRWLHFDGEHLVGGGLDVYGNGSMFVGTVDLIHNGADDECGCAICVRESTS